MGDGYMGHVWRVAAPGVRGRGQVLVRLLPEWRAGGHRVLLFSQTRMTLDMLETLVAVTLGLTTRRMDGTTPIATRQAPRERERRGNEAGACRVPGVAGAPSTHESRVHVACPPSTSRGCLESRVLGALTSIVH